MSTQEYCGRHSIHYPGRSCPRCDAEERHKELLNAAEESRAETVDAMRESDYRRANPGDYACPHCKYISLKNGASRCPLCHGDVGSEYWNRVRAAEQAAEKRRQAELEARVAEEKRTAPARAAAARAAEEKRQNDNRLKNIAGTVAGVFYACAAVAGVIGALETLKAVFQWFGYLFINCMNLFSPTTSISEIARHKYLGMGFAVFDFHGLPAALASPLFLAIAGACAIVGSWARIVISRRKQN